MPLPSTIKAQDMRSINRLAVLELVRCSGPIARSVIARSLGLSLPTVTRIIGQLIEEGMVRATGQTEPSRGRPRDLLAYNKDGYAVIGVDLGGTKMFGALANMGGEVLAEISEDRHATSGHKSFELLVELIDELVRLPRHEDQPIRGIAVGAPGVTLSGPGIVQWAPSLNWRAFPLRQMLEQRFQYPVIVENDVNLAALGELWFGAGQGTSNMVLIAIGTGVGAGLIINGALYRGHTESAGEVGYLVPDRSALGKRYNGFGALESLASGTGVAERARQALAGRWSAEQLAELTSHQVFDHARRQEEWACRVLDETADYLSIAIADISAILDPELVVLGGGVSNSADLLIDPILERIKGVVPSVPRLAASTLGARAAVMGAAALVLQATSESLVVQELP
jgi:glucokinase